MDQAKDRGEICRYHDCREPRPQHLVLWKCPNGHSTKLWYCASHRGPMTELALTTASSGGGILCDTCGAVMRPVLDGMPG